MTQLQTIEKHLIEQRTISAWDAITLYRITCLNKMIQLLRKKYNITDKWFKHNGKHFKVYFFEGAK